MNFGGGGGDGGDRSQYKFQRLRLADDDEENDDHHYDSESARGTRVKPQTSRKLSWKQTTRLRLAAIGTDGNGDKQDTTNKESSSSLSSSRERSCTVCAKHLLPVALRLLCYFVAVAFLLAAFEVAAKELARLLALLTLGIVAVMVVSVNSNAVVYSVHDEDDKDDGNSNEISTTNKSNIHNNNNKLWQYVLLMQLPLVVFYGAVAIASAVTMDYMRVQPLNRLAWKFLGAANVLLLVGLLCITFWVLCKCLCTIGLPWRRNEKPGNESGDKKEDCMRNCKNETNWLMCCLVALAGLSFVFVVALFFFVMALQPCVWSSSDYGGESPVWSAETLELKPRLYDVSNNNARVALLLLEELAAELMVPASNGTGGQHGVASAQKAGASSSFSLLNNTMIDLKRCLSQQEVQGGVQDTARRHQGCFCATNNTRITTQFLSFHDTWQSRYTVAESKADSYYAQATGAARTVLESVVTLKFWL